MLSSSIFNDEDHFRRRLDSINKEMQAIIERTAVEHDKMLFNSTAGSFPFGITDSGDMGAATPVLPMCKPIVAAPAAHAVIDEATVRRIVSSEINVWKTSFEEMLSNAISGVKTSANQHLEEVKRCQMQLADSLGEATEASRRGLDEMRNALRRVQRTSGRSADEVSKDLEEYIVKNTSEQTLLRDAVAALQNEARIDRQRDDRRVDELARRHHDLVRNSLLELDAHASVIRDELHCLVRDKAQKASEERDVIWQQVSRLQGGLEAMTDTTARWVAGLRDLMEENIARQSEMRSLQRDVNRLEMLLQSVPLKNSRMHSSNSSGGDDESRVVEQGRETTRAGRSKQLGNGEIPPEEFLALKENVRFLMNSVASMQARVKSMESALSRLVDGESIAAAAAVGAPRDGSGAHVPESCADLHNGGVSHGAFNSTAPSVASKSMGSLGFCYSRRMPSVGATVDQSQRMGAMMMAGGAPRGHSVVSSLQQQQQQQQQQPPRHDLRLHQHYHQHHSHYQYHHLHYHQHPLPHHHQHHHHHHHQQQQSSRSPTHATSENLEQREESENVSPPRFADPVPATLDTTSTCHEPNRSPLPAYGSLVSSAVPTPSDSYVSDTVEAQNGEETSMQYVPAPTSDIESELANKKMARLALD